MDTCSSALITVQPPSDEGRDRQVERAGPRGLKAPGGQPGWSRLDTRRGLQLANPTMVHRDAPPVSYPLAGIITPK